MVVKKEVPKGVFDIIDFIRREKNVNLSYYRPTFIFRRIKVRMGACQASSLSDYKDILVKDDQEWDRLANVLSVNVSKFFRDKDVFDYFADNCLRELFDKKIKRGQKTLRIWSAGCSCGEEPYSLAIILKDRFTKEINNGMASYVLATDMDFDALNAAKKGVYRKERLENISSFMLKNYFNNIGNGNWAVKDEVKGLVKFKKQNLLADKTLRFIDVIFCRNVRIYFDQKEAEKLLWNMYESLNNGGYLVLGKIEILPIKLRKAFNLKRSKER